MANQALQDCKDHLAKMESQDQRAPRGTVDSLDCKDYQVPQDHLETKVLLAVMDLQESQVNLVLGVHQVWMAILEHLV